MVGVVTTLFFFYFFVPKCWSCVCIIFGFHPVLYLIWGYHSYYDHQLGARWLLGTFVECRPYRGCLATPGCCQAPTTRICTVEETSYCCGPEPKVAECVTKLYRQQGYGLPTSMGQIKVCIVMLLFCSH